MITKKYILLCLLILSTWQDLYSDDMLQNEHRIPSFFDPVVLEERKFLLDLAYLYNKSFSSLNYGLTKQFTFGIDFLNMSDIFLDKNLNFYLKGRYQFLNKTRLKSAITTFYNISTSDNYTFYNQ